MDWRLMLFVDLRAVRNQAALTGLLTAVAAGFVALLGLFLNQRRRILRQKLQAQRMLQEANAELEGKVARRTRALTEANVRLRKEVAEREQAEQTLRAAQNELVHAAKMAVLGQLATGITHELTQPLGAIRTLSGNASEFLRRGDLKAVEGNLAIVARLADQMGGIIHPLKGFARKAPAMPQATDVTHALSNALFLYNQRLRKEQVQLLNLAEPAAGAARVLAWCDPNRLEQVLINLIGNALDAMKETPERVLHLSAGVGGALSPSQAVARAVAQAAAEQEGEALPPELGRSEVWVRVQDSGSGFSPAQHARLFEPFFSTKEAGAGLGLGLAISRDIVRAFGGDIEAHSPAPDGRGACFTVRLPAAPQGVAATAPSAIASKLL
jgi:C4-dicarboxylate-specific signal transduction histidine kinase